MHAPCWPGSASASLSSTAHSRPAPAPLQVYENQRFFGIAWCVPLLPAAPIAQCTALQEPRKLGCVGHSAAGPPASLQCWPLHLRRKPPLSVLDWPEWSDAEGRPVALAHRPTDDDAHWELAVTPGTDDEGWQYATVFK